MAAANSTNFAPIASFFEKATLDVAKPLCTLEKFAVKKTLPKRNSKTMVFSRYERLAPLNGYASAVTKALIEGVVPTAVNPTRTDITVSLSQYGNLSENTDIATWVNESDVDSEVVARNSQNMVETVERVYWAGIVGGTTVQRLTDDIGGVSGVARVNVAGRINAVALNKALRTLRVNEALRVTSQLGASAKIGTQGVRDAYIAIVPSIVVFDLEQIVGYIPVTSYPSQDGVYPGEVGAYKNIRFIESNLASAFANAGASVAGTYSTGGSNSDVFAVMIFGKNAFATVELASSAETTYIPAGTKDKADPLGQISCIGWKAMCASVILNESWMLRMEVVASA